MAKAISKERCSSHQNVLLEPKSPACTIFGQPGHFSGGNAHRIAKLEKLAERTCALPIQDF
jgi:hypothetical protein